MPALGVYRKYRRPRVRSRRRAFNGPTPLVAPVLSFVYATSGAIRLSWTDATGGFGPYTYAIKRNASTLNSNAASPYDDSAGLSHGVLYAYTVVVTDGDGLTATSNSVSVGLPFDGTGGGATRIFRSSIIQSA